MGSEMCIRDRAFTRNHVFRINLPGHRYAGPETSGTFDSPIRCNLPGIRKGLWGSVQGQLLKTNFSLEWCFPKEISLPCAGVEQSSPDELSISHTSSLSLVKTLVLKSILDDINLATSGSFDYCSYCAYFSIFYF